MAENSQHIFVQAQVQTNCFGSALLVARAQCFEQAVVGLTGFIKLLNFFSIQWISNFLQIKIVFPIFIDAEEFSAAVSLKFEWSVNEQK